jgi:predicted ATP-grasp superfamily ATP-dependent carboligase
MKAIKEEDAEIRKPMVIAAMQDMGNVGSIVMDFINKSLGTKPFRHIPIPFPNYIIDNRGQIDFQQEKLEYKYGSERSIVIFGGEMG